MVRLLAFTALLFYMLVIAAPQGEADPSSTAPDYIVKLVGDTDKIAGWTSGSGTGVYDEEFELQFPSGKKPKCRLTGKATETFVQFDLTDSDDYLHPCGEFKGLTVTCTDPAATCTKG